jgi:hypothetical protein
MKQHFLNFRFMLVAFLLLSTPPAGAQSISRSDELVCIFTNGLKATIVQYYDWKFLAAMIPADVTTKEYTYRRIRLRDAKGKKSAWLELSGDSGIGHEFNFVNAQPICANLIFGNLNLRSGDLDDLDKDLKWITQSIKVPDKLRLSKTRKEQTPEIRSELVRLQLSPDLRLTASFGKILVSEQAFFDISPQGSRKDEYLTITAVYQSESLDDGATWSDPIITKDAKIFQLGKSIFAQPFVGIPYSFNGKRFTEKRPTY